MRNPILSLPSRNIKENAIRVLNGGWGLCRLRPKHWKKERLSTPGRDWIKGEEMSATSHGRRSWKDNPTAKAIAATISLLLIASLIAVLAFALLSMQ